MKVAFVIERWGARPRVGRALVARAASRFGGHARRHAVRARLGSLVLFRRAPLGPPRRPARHSQATAVAVGRQSHNMNARRSYQNSWLEKIDRRSERNASGWGQVIGSMALGANP